MRTVLVLVCSVSVTPDYLQNCDRNNAVQVMQLPEQIASPSMCAMRGQAYLDRKSTRLNSSHANISYAVFCLKKKKKTPVIFNSKSTIITILNLKTISN